MSETDREKRTQVVTYLPSSQKRRWKEHAAELEMSQAEFVRTMVQAGRKGFELPAKGEAEEGSTHTYPRGNDLEDRILDAFGSREVLSWDELVDRLAGDFETRLETALDSLQARDRVRYRGRDGGYTLVE